MIIHETNCPCCNKDIELEINGWFLLKEPLPELIACVKGEPGANRPADIPLMGMSTSICPQCGKQCMIDFQFEVARYLKLLEESFPDQYTAIEEVEDNEFFDRLVGELSQMAIANSVDVTCLS